MTDLLTLFSEHTTWTTSERVIECEALIRADERARLAAILRTHYDEDADRVTFGDFESCSDSCPGIVMDHVLKLLDTP